MSGTGSPLRQPLSDSEFLLCCIDAISNGEIDYTAVAKAANYANDSRARARLSRINAKHGTRPRAFTSEEEGKGATEDPTEAKNASIKGKDAATEVGKQKVRFADDTAVGIGRITRSSAAKVPTSDDAKVEKKKPVST
ncbi:hypothetical protein TWF481_001118 [Arthrobotrys musiformis]|uniref:Myb-like DNA-binding domain-containing protein n=1 Tax=Arthrobotrys musiformis TaxID=47236 RepID=A0AAV9WPM2_9PEZI